jgi:integrase
MVLAMPYVVRHASGRSPFWYAVYRDPWGRRLKKSTKLTSKSKALEMAHTLQKAANEARQHRLTEARTRELLSEILQSVNGEGLRMFTVAEWFDHFVKQKQKSRADKTALRHEQMMREFVEFLGYRARLNIAAITSKDIADFRDHRERLALAPSTLNGDVTILSAAFNAALKQGHVSVNPCAAIEPVRDKVTARKDTFTPGQVRALITRADGDWPGLIRIAFYCGQRLGDCASLQWKQINLLGDIKTIRFQQGKTGREIVTVIHPELEKFLRSLHKQRKVVPLSSQSDEAYVFPSLAQQAQRNISPLSKAFRKLMARTGIRQHVIRDRNASGSGRRVNALSFHSLRHGFVSCLANSGVPEEIRMALAGHTSREMGQRYTHRELAIYRDAVAVLPRV